MPHSTSVNSYLAYYAYERVWDNSYKLIELPNTVITETDKRMPQYKVWNVCQKSSWFGFEKALWGRQFYECEEKKEIFVPKGTIQKKGQRIKRAIILLL